MLLREMMEVTKGKMRIEAKEERDDFEFADYFGSLCVYKEIKTMN